MPTPPRGRIAAIRLLLAAAVALACVTLPSSPATAASTSPVRIDLQIYGEIDTCVGVTGPAACMYQHYSVGGTADPEHYRLCFFRAYHQPNEFWDEYQQVCEDVPADHFVIDSTKWESVTILPTTLTFTEGAPEEFVLAATLTTHGFGMTGSGVDKQQTGACVEHYGIHYVSGSAETVLTVDGESHVLPSGLFGAKVVDTTKCRPVTSSAVGGKTTDTYLSVTVFPCQDYPIGATCVEQSVVVNDSYMQPDALDVCTSIYTYAIGTGEFFSSEYGCATVPPTTLTLDRRRLDTGELSPVTLTVYDYGSGASREITVELLLTGTGELMTSRTKGRRSFNGCVVHSSGTSTDRYVTGIMTLDGVAQDLHSGYVLLGDYDERPCSMK
jgi:hypothetical protein